MTKRRKWKMDGKLHYTLAALAPSLFEDGGVAVGGF